MKAQCPGCRHEIIYVIPRLAGNNYYITCDFCGCAIKVERPGVFACSVCGIKVIRDPGFAGDKCAVCEDHQEVIMERVMDIAKDYNITEAQLIHIIQGSI